MNHSAIKKAPKLRQRTELSPHTAKGAAGSPPSLEPCCVDSARSLCVLQIHPTEQKHTCCVDWQLVNENERLFVSCVSMWLCDGAADLRTLPLTQLERGTSNVTQK